MTEIASKIDSIRNMTADLNSIKIISQRNTEKMIQNLADFRHRISNQMTQIENTHRNPAQIHKGKDERKLDQGAADGDMLNSDSDSNDAKQMSFILKEIKNVQAMSKELLVELEDYPEPMTDVSSNPSKIGSNNKENFILSTDTLASSSGNASNVVNVLFSKKLPYSPSDAQETNNKLDPSDSDQILKSISKGKNIDNQNDPMTKAKIDKLTRKLKDIQTQNDELRNVNENIQNLLMKLNDLKYADAETNDKLKTVQKNSQPYSATYLPRKNSTKPLEQVCLHPIDSESSSEAEPENFRKFIRSVKITNKTRGNMLTKIKVAKLLIKKLRSNGNIVDREDKYKVRVRQDEQMITLKAHHNKPQ